MFVVKLKKSSESKDKKKAGITARLFSEVSVGLVSKQCFNFHFFHLAVFFQHFERE